MLSELSRLRFPWVHGGIAFFGSAVLLAETVAVVFQETVLPAGPGPWLSWLLHMLFLSAAVVAGSWIVGARAAGFAARNEAFTKDLLDTITDGVVVADERGIIRSCNATLESMFGYERGEIVGQNVKILVPHPFQEQHEDYLSRAGGAERMAVLRTRRETVGQRKDGTIVPIDLAVRQMGHEPERHYVAVVSDITERQRVSQKLQDAKRAADAANHAKSCFLANMSHEIRTPMTAILGFTRLMQTAGDELDETKRQDYLNTIHTSGSHLLDLINDILDLSKIEAGQISCERAVCSPHEVIDDVATVLRAKAIEKEVSLEYVWRSRVPETIRSDANRLRQLLINLVGNAIKFTRQGSVRIEAELVAAGDRPQLAIEVIDTGIGIAADKLQNIFEPFVQADSSVTREFGGTGLGLSICRSIVQSLGGELTVLSQVGLGSVFRATIDTGPLDGVTLWDVPPSKTSPSAVPPTEVRTPTLPGTRVLLVEDGDTNRKLIRLILRRAGAEVVEAENGEIGVQCASRGEFDVILMDMQMPVMDGYTATRTLRLAGIQAPILALTAHAMTGDEEKCRAVGCSGYLTKPIDTEQLLAAVAVASEARRCGGTPPLIR